MKRAELLVRKFNVKDKTLSDITDEALIEQSGSLVESIKVTVGDITLAKEPGALKLADLLLRKKAIRDLYESLENEIMAVVGGSGEKYPLPARSRPRGKQVRQCPHRY